MSTPVPDPATAATGVSTQQAAQNATDDADKHTPDTDHVAPPVHATEDATEPKDGMAELREQVGNLATAVTTLTDLVMKRTDPDSSPTEKLPFLLRGKRGVE